jgi:hypothetical protein
VGVVVNMVGTLVPGRTYNPTISSLDADDGVVGYATYATGTCVGDIAMGWTYPLILSFFSLPLYPFLMP